MWGIIGGVYLIVVITAIGEYARHRSHYWMGGLITLIIAPPFLAATYWLLFRLIAGSTP